MSRIKGKDTKPELLVRKYLHAHGFRYRLHDKKLPGKPDIVLPKYKTVIFIHGCFWHGHDGCKYFVVPKTNKEWWMEKISNNKKKDEKDKDTLVSLGWKVIVIWSCKLNVNKKYSTLRNLMKDILYF